MPNNPLTVFRAVEPPFAGFQAAAGLASVPFVLSWCKTSLTGSAATSGTILHRTSTNTTTTGVGWDNTTSPVGITLDADRAIPWVARNKDEIYPVAVPNAYERIYIFPLFIIEGTVSGARLTPPAVSAAHNGPSILPFGLLPGTRNASTAAALNDRGTRFPDDLMAKQATPLSYDYSTRTNGSWLTLPPYGSNFTTNNSLVVTNTEASPASFGRSTLGLGSTTGGLGVGYRFNPDYTISKSTSASATGGSNARFEPSSSLTGIGMEFSLQGCQEVVVVPQDFPDTLTWSTVGSNEVFRVHMFMMGVLLG